MGSLCTLAEAKEEAAIPDSVETHDAVLARLITVASEQLRLRYANEFDSVVTITAEPHYHVRTNEIIILNYSPVTEVVSVAGYNSMTDTTSVELTENDYWRLIDPTSGLLEFLVTAAEIPTGLDTPVSYYAYTWDRIEVTYKSGYTQAPASVSRACAMMAAHWFSKLGRDLDLKSFGLGDLRETFEDHSLWPPMVIELMAPWSQDRMGVV